MQALNTLDLSNNKMGVEGAKHLADAFRNNAVSICNLFFSVMYILTFWIKTLTTLNLSDNKIGDQGAQYLADTFQNNEVMITFFFSISFTCAFIDTCHA